MPLFAVQTTASQEGTVASMIVEREVDGIYATLAPDQMPSYIVVEAETRGVIERVIEDIPHARKVVKDGSMTMNDIEHFLEETSDVEGIAEGDFVEITGGPYQGEKARVQRVDDGKEQVTVELAEATVPIPVTLRGDQIKVLDSDERETA